MGIQQVDGHEFPYTDTSNLLSLSGCIQCKQSYDHIADIMFVRLTDTGEMIWWHSYGQCTWNPTQRLYSMKKRAFDAMNDNKKSQDFVKRQMRYELKKAKK